MDAHSNTTSRRDFGSLVSIRRGPWILAAAVLIAGLLWLGSEGTYHGDERFYMDAAVRMLASGDYWRPEYADGTARLNKPLLDYWLISLSFHLFGPTLFAARLPFLLAGSALVGVTGRLARALFPTEPHAPLLAAAIAASNVSLVALSTRCTPDILLVLAASIAWVGMAELLVEGRSPRRATPWLWIGIGFSAAAKGSLAIVLLAYALAAIAVSRRAIRGRGLVHAPASFAAIVIAAVSLAPLWFNQAHAAGPSFVSDQVTSRIADSVPAAVELAGEYVASLARHFLPWILAPLALLLVDGERAIDTWRRHRRALVLVLGFGLTLLALFASANLHRGRYLSPAYPALACAVAVFVPPAMESRAVRAAVRAAIAVAAILAGTIGVVLARVDGLPAISAVGATAMLGWMAWKPLTREAGTALAVAISAVELAVVPAVRHAFRSDYYARAAASERLDATWGFDPSTPNVVRMLSDARLDPRPWPEAPAESDFASAEVVLVIGPASDALGERGWSLQPCGFRARSLRASDVPHLLLEPDPRAWFAEQGQPVFLARRGGP